MIGAHNSVVIARTQGNRRKQQGQGLSIFQRLLEPENNEFIIPRKLFTGVHKDLDMTMWHTIITVAAAAIALTAAHPQATPSAVPPTENGALVHPFDLGQVQLTSGSRWMENQNRTVAYLKFIDVNRMLYVFRQNHKLPTQGAAKNGGWDAPDFPFRGHFQGHLLTAWAQCWQTTDDSICKDRALSFVAELAKCQANNAAAGWNKGYLNAFSEKDFDLMEQGKLSSGVPYYVIHKTMAGLLDVWQVFGDATAKSVLLELGGWVDVRTAKLSTDQMQRVLATEHGGMVAVFADMYFATGGDKKWLAVAQRFEHNSVVNPLASNQDSLNGLHANTQIPKWIGSLRQFKATGTARYKAIAANAWSMVVGAHTYAIGSNSQAEHFKPPNAISGYLKSDAGESCNTYNMLKLTRELWTLDPTNVVLTDYYERALLNQMLGQQNPADAHGHVTYFHSLQPGARRGVGPAWGGGTWSTDYDSFWCCQGTGTETHTKFADSIYFYDEGALYVNLFTASKLNWARRGVTVTQSTAFPVQDTSTIKISAVAAAAANGGETNFAIKIRIPGWTTSGATVTVTDAEGHEVAALSGGSTVKPGSYASIGPRNWAAGDTITVRLPLAFRLLPTNDNKNLAAVAYGPTVLVGNYGNTAVTAAPQLKLDSLQRTASDKLAFSARAIMFGSSGSDWAESRLGASGANDTIWPKTLNLLVGIVAIEEMILTDASGVALSLTVSGHQVRQKGAEEKYQRFDLYMLRYLESIFINITRINYLSHEFRIIPPSTQISTMSALGRPLTRTALLFSRNIGPIINSQTNVAATRRQIHTSIPNLVGVKNPEEAKDQDARVSGTATKKKADLVEEVDHLKGQVHAKSGNEKEHVEKKLKEKKKTLAELDEELRVKMEGVAGDGGASGVEYEDGKPVAMKRLERLGS
ncbi:hypothetical protein B0H66DRAFT_535017 [Apodospora peruviana]|uniref:DUF1680-domain-containing protein n=1 Tax=Apodospora peruviana TaxID=516989 RepID=A0AAE0I360_9PEZI|nr:hypothetical protein B0H66DRAFT_535017 [Apodospora peruviana]